MTIETDLKREISATAAQVRTLEPEEQIVIAGEIIEMMKAGIGEMSTVRRTGVRSLRASGWKLRDIAAATGLTHQRIYQLEQGQDRKDKG